jgi:hypothetical protein
MARIPGRNPQVAGKWAEDVLAAIDRLATKLLRHAYRRAA